MFPGRHSHLGQYTNLQSLDSCSCPAYHYEVAPFVAVMTKLISDRALSLILGRVSATSGTAIIPRFIVATIYSYIVLTAPIRLLPTSSSVTPTGVSDFPCSKGYYDFTASECCTCVMVLSKVKFGSSCIFSESPLFRFRRRFGRESFRRGGRRIRSALQTHRGW